MRLARVPGVDSTILKAELLASQVPTETLVPEKLIGEFTSKVTSAAVPGTLAGMAFCEVASDTCQSSPEITSA